MILCVLFIAGFAGGLAAACLGAWFAFPAGESHRDDCGFRLQPDSGPVRSFDRLRLHPCSECRRRGQVWPWMTAVGLAILFAAFGWALLEWGVQTVPEVRPDASLARNRLPFQLLLLWLLATATVTDLLDYIIPDILVLSGTLFAIAAACISGELQIIHVWVDWNIPLADVMGPWLPDWMKQHQHLHGLVWSLTGMFTGLSLMSLLRGIASGILGYPAVGLGDVTLMAMIGAFLGWQPVLCTLVIAPVAGIVIGTGVRLFTGRSYVAFGPYLCAAAVVVLFTWKAIWMDLNLRMLFGHWPTVVAMTGGTFLAICLVLGLLRIYRAIPASAIRR